MDFASRSLAARISLSHKHICALLCLVSQHDLYAAETRFSNTPTHTSHNSAMARRARIVDDEDEDEEVVVQLSDAEEVAGTGEESDEEESQKPADKNTVSVLRAIMALHMQHTPIHRNNIKRVAFNDEPITSRSLDQAMLDAQKLLHDIYGFQLKPLPFKETTNPQGNTTVSKTQQYVLLSALQDEYLRFIQESNWLRTSTYLFESELLEKRGDYRNSREDAPVLTSDQQLMVQGLALTVVSLIVVNGNHMNETDLMKTLVENFGFQLNKDLDIIQMTPLNLLKLLDKYEYVSRTVIKNEQDEIVEYKIGRRALLEFDRDSFVEFVKILFDEPEDDPAFIKLIDATIENAYGKRLDPVIEADGDQEMAN